MGICRRPRLAALSSLFLLAAFMQPAAASGDGTGSMLQTDCADPPAIMAVADVRAGMTGKAYTTLSGREISEFDVEVLGVLPDAIYPLIDLILVEASGPALEAVGGIAGGFSGSPVYVDGTLIGAISYGFYGNAYIAGLTPAEAMLDITSYPGSPAPQLTSAARAALDLIEASVGPLGSPRPIPIPVGVGASAREIQELQAEVDSRGLPLRLFPAVGSGGGTNSSSPGQILPGESMSAVLSEGDNYAYGTGTATYCDGTTVLGFGHPMLWTGEVTMSMNEADVLTVIEDSTGYGNSKVVALGEPVGRIDFDANAGIRGIAGELVPAVPITSRAEFAEYGTMREGRTDAYVTDDLSFSLGWTAAGHLLTNLDYVSGTGYRPGSSAVEWTVEGARENGSPFSASFDNLYWDPWSITDSSVYELASFLDAVLFNSFEDVSVTAVDIGSAELFGDRRTISIAEVTVSTTSSPEPVTGYGFVQAQPGDLVTVEATMRPYGGDEFTETLEFAIPDDFVGGYGSLWVHGGSSEYFYFDPYYDEYYPPEVTDFDTLLAFLEGRDHNYDLVAELSLYTAGYEEEPPPEEPEPPPEFFIDANGGAVDETAVTIKAVAGFDAVVTGDAYFDFEVFGESPPVYGELFADLTGAKVLGGGDPDGAGTAHLYLDGDTILFDIDLDAVDEPITSVHIHAGYEGESGGMVADLDFEANGLSGAVFADPILLEEMLAVPEGFYLQVHSEAYPDGAVRGQLAYPPFDEGDGLAFVTSGGLWQLEGIEPFYFGTAGDIPFLGDWDGDGVETPGLYRPADGFAYVRNSLDTGVADESFYIGVRDDLPMVGDWDGDGIDTFGVYRPAEGKVLLRNSNETGVADVEYYFGVRGDIPFTGDFDGDGDTDVGLHRASTGLVYLRLTHATGPADLQFFWGVAGDLVLAGDWNGDGIDTVGLVRPAEAMFYCRNENSLGVADAWWPLAFAEPGLQVIVD